MSYDILTVEQEAQRLLEKLGNTTDFSTGLKYDKASCLQIAPLTLAINRLKREGDFFILAHYYTLPTIIYGVADGVGDSYALSKKAAQVSQKNIIFAGVNFMAQTAKIINPSKNVFNAALNAGCSLADSIDEQQVAAARQKYPQAAFVCYINSTAQVKALCDVCVTSSNVYDIICALPQKQIVFLPDVFMADNIGAELKRRGVIKDIIALGKTCCVHDRYTVQDVQEIRTKHPLAKLICHPECPLSVCELCDYVGSTAGMLKYVKESAAKEFAVLSETGIINCMEVENPSKTFLPVGRPCNQMKKNTLNNILTVLEKQPALFKVELPTDVMEKARTSIENMFKLTEAK